MSHRRTSLSFPLGILPILVLFDCSSDTRNWDTGSVAGSTGRVGGAAGVPSTDTGGVPSAGTAGNSTLGHAGTLGQAGATGGSSATAGTIAQAGSAAVGGDNSAQAGANLGGTAIFAGSGGLLQVAGTESGEAAGSPETGGGSGQAGTSALANGGDIATGGSPPSCTNQSQCDDGNACNGIETCVSGQCVPGTLPSACLGMDTANCKCTRIGSACGVQGLDADADGVKTRKCAADPGLDCNDGDASITYNACNGCAALTGSPGGACGSCGSSRWTCSGAEAVVCSTPSPAPKQCGATAVVQVCTAGTWTTETTCASPTPVCIVDAGDPKCGACDTAGVTRCKSGVANVVQTCATNRLSWTDTTCPGTNTCNYFGANDYRCSVCQPGTTKCKSSTVMQTCNAAGTGWTDTTCGTSSACFYSSALSMFGCFVQLLPGDLQNEIEFDRTVPHDRFDYHGPNAVGTQPFLDQASGFALA